MLQDLALALRLQALDRKMGALETEIAALPRQLAEVEKKLEAHLRRLDGDRAALLANGRDRKRFEGDIQVSEAKISKLKGQMLDAKTNEQYRAFQNEINYAEGEIRKAEDHILDLMEQSEPLEARVKSAEIELKAQQQHVEAEKATVRTRVDADKKQLAEQQAERAAIVGQLNPTLVNHYERIRKRSKGIAIADATDGRCSACQIALRPQFFQDLRRGDQIMFCETCGRILTYNPVVDLSVEAEPRPQTV